MSRNKDTTKTPVEAMEKVASALRVLAHPHRLMIVEQLMDAELTVGELAEALEIAPAACSQHLSLMRAHGLLKSTRYGRAVYYEVLDPAAANVIRCVHKHGPTA